MPGIGTLLAAAAAVAAVLVLVTMVVRPSLLAARLRAQPRPPAALTVADDSVYVVVLTDAHGFYSGEAVHREPWLDADLATVVSFVENLRGLARAATGTSVVFVENGDMVDGSGLSDAGAGKARRDLFAVLDQVPFDVRTVGNHELYAGDTLAALGPFLPGKFVTSNVVDAKSGVPLGARFKFVDLGSGSRMLVFGFLYDMLDNKAGVVEKVEDCVGSAWFANALRSEGVSAVMVLAHMGDADSLVRKMHTAIRAVLGPDMPILFCTGHTHVRASMYLDDNAFSFEAGRFLDTVGFVRFSKHRKSPSLPRAPDDNNNKNKKDGVFQHAYLDASRQLLMSMVCISQDTPTALGIRSELNMIRSRYQLDRVLGVLPQTYSLNQPLTSPTSLVRLWVTQVVETQLLQTGTTCTGFFVGGTGSLRFDLFAGQVTSDDVWAVAPFPETFVSIPCVPGNVLSQAVGKLRAPFASVMHDASLEPTLEQGGRKPIVASLPMYAFSPRPIHDHEHYDVVFGPYDAARILSALGMRDTVPKAFRPDRDAHSVWELYLGSMSSSSSWGAAWSAATASE